MDESQGLASKLSDWIYPLQFCYLDGLLKDHSFVIQNPSSSNQTKLKLVRIDLNNLPTLSSVLETLRDIKPPFAIWSSLALHYSVRLDEAACCSILEDALIHADRSSGDSCCQEAFCADLLANHFAASMSREEDCARKEELKLKARQYFERSEKLDPNGSHHRISMNCFEAVCGEDISKSQENLESMLIEAQNDRVVLQSLAAICFSVGAHLDCLAYCQRVLRTAPNSCLKTRLMMAQCLGQIGKPNLARSSYVRILELYPECMPALLNLSFYYLTDGSESSMTAGLEILQKVYRIRPSEPLIQDLIIDNICDMHVLKRNHPLDIYSVDAVNACCLGLAFHRYAKFDDAFHYYQKAVELSSEKWDIPLYGLAQLCCWKLELSEAARYLTILLRRKPDHLHGVKLLTIICLAMKSVLPSEISYSTNLKESLMVFADDADFCVAVADTLGSSDKKLALDWYLKAEKILLKKGIFKKIPAALQNNIAVLHDLSGDLTKAEHYYSLAETSAKTSGDSKTLVTLMFNKGCLSEEQLDYENARCRYNKILETHPGYPTAHFRLGILSLRCGMLHSAIKELENGLKVNPQNTDFSVFLGKAHLDKGQFALAEKYFDSAVDSPSVLSDNYLLLTIGNGYLDLLDSAPPAKSKTYAERAFSFFKRVLSVDGSNVYAANGMGAVLAKTGFQNVAEEIFSLLCDEHPEMTDAWINHGTVCADQRKFEEAVSIFAESQKLSKDILHGNASLLQRARSQCAKKDFEGARKSLQLLVRMYPESHSYRLNLGLVLKSSAVDSLRSFRTDPKKVGNAVQDIEIARNMFELLTEDIQDATSKERRRAEHEAKVCSDILRQSIHLVERSDSCSSLGSSGRISFSGPLTFGQLSPDEDVPVRRRNGSGSLGMAGKREAMVQRGSNQKGKLAKRQPEPCAVKKRSRKSAQLEEHYTIADAVPVLEKRATPPPVIEPQRKRARAVVASNELIERRRKRVADRKRRELEIERIVLTSSDDEISVLTRPARKKAERIEDNNAAKKRVAQRASLTSDSDNIHVLPHPNVRRRVDSDNVPFVICKIVSQPEVVVGARAVRKEMPHLLSTDSGSDSEARETESEENKSSFGDSDESSKRVNSELEGKPRKRKTLMLRN